MSSASSVRGPSRGRSRATPRSRTITRSPMRSRDARRLNDESGRTAWASDALPESPQEQPPRQAVGPRRDCPLTKPELYRRVRTLPPKFPNLGCLAPELQSSGCRPPYANNRARANAPDRRTPRSDLGEALTEDAVQRARLFGACRSDQRFGGELVPATTGSPRSTWRHNAGEAPLLATAQTHNAQSVVVSPVCGSLTENLASHRSPTTPSVGSPCAF